MKKTNSNNWDMVYKKCNHNRYSKFNGVKNPVELKSNFANLLKNCYIAIITFLIIALVLLIYTFKSNPMIIVYCLIFLAGLFVYESLAEVSWLLVNEVAKKHIFHSLSWLSS